MADVVDTVPGAGRQTFAVTQIGKYRVLRLLGRGSMGEVYLAEDPHIQRSVAVKVMRSTDDDGDAARFLHEARILGGFSHPNIVIVHDFGFHDGKPFLVMEHLAGQGLDEWIGEDHTLEQHLAIMEDLLSALQYSHRQGVLHRDLKPANVRVMPDGQCKLVDFGIARAPAATLTTTGMIMGTPAYMAPEILLDALYSTSADIYSAALVLYEMLARRNPFRAKSLPATMNSVLTLRPVPLGSLRPDVPPPLCDAIMTCLEKDPRLRPRDLTGLAVVVGELRRMGTVAAPPRPRLLHSRRGRALVAAAAGGVLAVLSLLAVGTWRSGTGGSTPRGESGAVAAVASAPPSPLPPLPLPARPGPPDTAGPVASAAPRTDASPRPMPLAAPGPRPTPSAAARAQTVDAALPAALLAAAAAAKASPPAPEPDPSTAAAAALSLDGAAATPGPGPAPASLLSLSTRFVRRRTTLLIELRGTGFRRDHRVLVVRGRQQAVGIRVIRQDVVNEGLIRAMVMVDEDVPLGTYSVALVDGEGRFGRRLSLEVVL